MSPDTVAIVIAVLGTGTALAVLIVPGRRDVAGLYERMARREGLFEGFTHREPAAPGTGTE